MKSTTIEKNQIFFLKTNFVPQEKLLLAIIFIFWSSFLRKLWMPTFEEKEKAQGHILFLYKTV